MLERTAYLEDRVVILSDASILALFEGKNAGFENPRNSQLGKVRFWITASNYFKETSMPFDAK